MNFDPAYPIYLGVSKTFFNALRLTGRLADALKADFTISMEEAEIQARAAAAAIGEEIGVVIKFETAELAKHPLFQRILDDVEDVIEGIFKFITGFYEVSVTIVVVENGGNYC